MKGPPLPSQLILMAKMFETVATENERLRKLIARGPHGATPERTTCPAFYHAGPCRCYKSEA